jgi:hypothetical protein
MIAFINHNLNLLEFKIITSKTKVKLDQASKAIGEAEYKGNVIKNKLQNVEKLPLSK